MVKIPLSVFDVPIEDDILEIVSSPHMRSAVIEENLREKGGILERLLLLKLEELDDLYIRVKSHGSLSKEKRAALALDLMMYHALFSPYSHAKRNFYMDPEPLVFAINDCAKAVRKYGVHVLEKPRKDVYVKLKMLADAKELGKYLTFCAVMCTVNDIAHIATYE